MVSISISYFYLFRVVIFKMLKTDYKVRNIIMFVYAIHTHSDNNLILQSCFLSFAIPNMYTHDQKILALTESMKMTLLSGDKTSIVLFPGNYSS